jgi:DNA (cytosine-5)-methyltransferase 1
MIYKSLKTGLKFIDISEDLGKNEQQLSVISLFSGAGGLDLGLENAGFNTVLCIENDIHCRETLKFNRPNWKVFEEPVKIVDGSFRKREPGDIRDIEVEEALAYINLDKTNISLVVGGAPCQPFSNIGKREGKNDKKNGDLFAEFVRFVKEISPEAFIFENVVGITQRKHAEVIDYMITKFSGLGYGISHAVLNAANYGVPQRRERFFLIGIKGINEPAFPLPTHFKSQELWESFIDELSPTYSENSQPWVTVKEAFDKIPEDAEKRPDYAVMNISGFVKERMTYIQQGQNFKVLPENLRPDCWKSGKHQGQDTFGRLYENLPSVTIRTAAYNPAKGMYIHPNHNRGLNTIEMAYLQSFPSHWVFKCHNREKVTLVSGGKQIGNAVPPLLAKALGIAIKKQILSKYSVSVEKPNEPGLKNLSQKHHPPLLEVS